MFLRICAFEVIRKGGFQNGLVRLVSFGGAHSQAAVGFTIKGPRCFASPAFLSGYEIVTIIRETS